MGVPENLSHDGSHDGSHDLAVFPEGMRGKRVLLCTESFGPVNGVSRTTLMLVNHLRANGANVAVVAPYNHTKVNTFVPAEVPNSGTAHPSVPLNPELRIQGYPLPYNPELSIVYPVRVSSLYARTFGAPPDLIYLASPASLGFQVLLQLRQQPRAAQVPVLLNFQTDLASYAPILIPPPFGAVAGAMFHRIEGFLFRHRSVRTVFYPSRYVARYLRRNGVAEGKMRLLQRGVDTAMFTPARRSEGLRAEIAPGGEVVLICVARLAGEKGFEFLAAVARELDGRGLAFKLYIVGGNRNQEVEAEVHAMFTDLQRRGKVIFAGFKVSEELATAYASADLFLHCSITETFGLVVLEAMASGVPVVARDEGGPSDIVDHGASGFLVPPVAKDEFVEKVLLLAKDKALLRTFSEQARKQACEATWEKINNKVAWGMMDAIEEREKEIALLNPETQGQKAQVVSPALPWPVWNDILQGRIVDARVFGGLGIIMGFWGIVGMYLFFIKMAIWAKSQLRG